MFSKTWRPKFLKNYFQPFLATRTTTTGVSLKWMDRISNTTSAQKMNSQHAQSFYDQWSAEYDDCLTEWGYCAPKKIVELLQSHITDHKQSNLQIYDCGCGTGLVGKELVNCSQFKCADIHGSDISEMSVAIALDTNVYKQIKICDLNVSPYPYGDCMFDVILCVGVLTNCEDKWLVFNEWQRIAKPNALILVSHRTDNLVTDLQYFQQMENEGKWKLLEHTSPLPYLPNNECFANNILVEYLVNRVIKD